ncbi:MAG: hypothetical protein NZ602_13975 [Thermoguttaceae bacterium]|nr:hypothetical protein [Thermoguttaceae bacterium]MDW8039425.1 hypothetical protein [Thermoguttaceae bacterium]
MGLNWKWVLGGLKMGWAVLGLCGLWILWGGQFSRGEGQGATIARAEPKSSLDTQKPNTWVKRSPLADTPPSPRLGYEGACVWDSRHRVLIRYGGHNQGGGGEQGSELWTFDLQTATWTLKEPNISPPGLCCAAQHVFDPIRGLYIRFPSFSGNHGWQWHREIYLNESSVWVYDLGRNIWRNRQPLPAPHVAPLRCAAWDWHSEQVVIFGGEGSREGTLIYDPYRNEWFWPKPPQEPPFRSGGQMAYDIANRVHVLFGSQFTDDPHTWAYDRIRNVWLDMKPPLLPPTNQNDAVLAYDSLHGVVLAVVKITEGEDQKAKHRLETWAYRTKENRWQKTNPPQEPDPSGNRARQLIFAPEFNVFILENCTHPPHGPREQQIWTYRYAEGKGQTIDIPPLQRDRPPIVEELVVSVLGPDRIELCWKEPEWKHIHGQEELVRPTGYLVERAPVEVLSEDQLTRLKSRVRPLEQPSVGAIRRIGPFRRISPELIRQTEYVDTSVDLRKPTSIQDPAIFERSFGGEQLDRTGRPYRYAVYAYRVRCVNAKGQEGGPSPAVLTIPSAPQWLFSQEAGTTCRLKWAANPEKNLKGYRVYRLDGRWDKDPISRLTPEPISQLQFEDTTAGDQTRRYYVVAVDALGQEGHPSSPVWFNREWKRFYEPFVGPWHQ